VLPLQKLATLRPLVWAGVLFAGSIGLVVRDRLTQGRPWEAAAWAVLGGLLLLALAIRRRGRPQLLPWSICFVLGLIGYAVWFTSTTTGLRAAGFVLAAVSVLAMMLLPRTRRSTEDEPPITLDL
jgi:hypothetical protein